MNWELGSLENYYNLLQKKKREKRVGGGEEGKKTKIFVKLNEIFPLLLQTGFQALGQPCFNKARGSLAAMCFNAEQERQAGPGS